MLAYDSPREITVDDLLAFVRVFGVPLEEFVLPAAITYEVGGWGAYMTAVDSLERLQEAQAEYDAAVAQARELVAKHAGRSRDSSGIASGSLRPTQTRRPPRCRPSMRCSAPRSRRRRSGHDRQAAACARGGTIVGYDTKAGSWRLPESFSRTFRQQIARFRLTQPVNSRSPRSTSTPCVTSMPSGC